jgi:hypothetical protein
VLFYNVEHIFRSQNSEYGIQNQELKTRKPGKVAVQWASAFECASDY